MDPRDLLSGSFQAALAAADPLLIVPPHLPAPPRGRTLVVGAGKAAASMALAVERHWNARSALEGVVITRYGHGLPLARIRVVEAGHPVPDEKGERAAREILSLARGLGEDDLLLVLVSGGGSSLLALPVEGVAMADLKAVTRDLLASGAPIQDMNTVRKHLSLIQGGRLAAATRASVLALVISDATGHASLMAGADFVKRHGVTPVVLGDSVTGEAAEVAKAYAALAREIRVHSQPFAPPVALISGGETTVTLRRQGRGGRCSEFLLSLGIAFDGLGDAWALACDTDGIDGTEENAGALLTPDALQRAGALGLSAKKMLADNDSYGFFAALGDLVVTGPTRTNVNDYRIIVIR